MTAYYFDSTELIVNLIGNGTTTREARWGHFVRQCIRLVQVGTGVRIAENELRSWAINAGAPRTNGL